VRLRFPRPGIGPRSVARDSNRGAVQLLDLVFEPDGRELVPARVEGERLEHVGARFSKLDMELVESLGMLEHHFGRERAGAHPTSLFELEQVTSIAEDRSFSESFENVLLHRDGLLRKSFNARCAALYPGRR
jgi:hypothetical protein